MSDHPSPGLATATDVSEFRAEFFVPVPGIGDDEVIEAMNTAPHLLALARIWGWNETQVRDDFSALLRRRGHVVEG